MEKYYCDNCRILYDLEDTCTVCGKMATNKIWIEVQNHKSSNQNNT